MEAAQQQAEAQAGLEPQMEKLALDSETNGHAEPTMGTSEVKEIESKYEAIPDRKEQPAELGSNSDNKLSLGTVLAAGPQTMTNGSHATEVAPQDQGLTRPP